MKKIFILPFLLFVLSGFAQTPHKTSGYLFADYNKTISDITLGNNPWGAGIGALVFYNNKTKFKPGIELTGNIYLVDDKVFRTYNGSEIESVRGMINLFAGSSFTITPIAYVSLFGGPAFINGKNYFGVKPSLGIYFSKKQQWTGKISYLNIYNRDAATGTDFTSISISLGVKLF